MNLLAFDTSTDHLRVAVQARAGEPLAVDLPGGAQSSATLLPTVQSLLSEAGLALSSLDAIVFGRGPGSFTGLRTACAVAQGLAFGGDLPVLPVETLMAVAEDARERYGARQVVVALDARMDQVYWAAYGWAAGAWTREGEIRVEAPEAVRVPQGHVLAGNAATVYGARLGAGPQFDAVPSARALLRLAPALVAAGGLQPALHATPLYIRDKVAQTSQERALARATPITP